MRTVAITGAGGMIGRHLVEALAPLGVEIRALLLASEAVPPGFDGVAVHRGDVRDRAALVPLMTGADVVIHLAALVGRDANAATLAAARDVNVAGTGNVAEVAAMCGVGRLVLLSTCCVYGLYGTRDEIVDEARAHAPDPLPYDLTKTEAERLVTGLPTTPVAWSVLQIPVALGGAHTLDKPTGLSLVRLARLGLVPGPLAGASWANYVFGADVAAALVLLAHHEKAIGETFIYSESVPLRDLVGWVSEDLGRRPALPVPIPGLAFTTKLKRSLAPLANRRRFCSKKITEYLGFRPPVGLRAGVRTTLHHYREAGHIA